MRRYSNRTPLTTRSKYNELGVERLTNVLGRHAEMFRARANPGNALGLSQCTGAVDVQSSESIGALHRVKKFLCTDVG